MSLTESVLTTHDMKKIVKEAVTALIPETVVEAYVATPKQYDIPTEALPAETKAEHTELYKKYVKSLSSVSAELDTVGRKDVNYRSSELGSLKRDEVFNLNAVYLHELYFANIGDVSSEILQDNLSYMRLARDFGTFDDWQRDFMACAMAAREGWVVCGYSTYLNRYINCVIDLHHMGIPVGFYPVIVVDMWTHAIPPETERKPYIASMMREFNWEVIDNRFKRADRIVEALR